MTEIFFTADQHLGHAGIMSENTMGRGAQFATLDGMNDYLIEQWRSTVGTDDIVWCLGDLFFRVGVQKVQAFLARLTGRIFVAPGNHDFKMWEKFGNRGDIPEQFTVMQHNRPVCFDYRMNGRLVMLNHYLLDTWVGKDVGACLLYGHSHGARQGEVPATLDVGWDVHKKLLTFEETREALLCTLDGAPPTCSG